MGRRKFRWFEGDRASALEVAIVGMFITLGFLTAIQLAVGPDTWWFSVF